MTPTAAAVLTVDIDTGSAASKLGTLQTALVTLGLGGSGAPSPRITQLESELKALRAELETTNRALTSSLAKMSAEVKAEAAAARQAAVDKVAAAKAGSAARQTQTFKEISLLAQLKRARDAAFKLEAGVSSKDLLPKFGSEALKQAAEGSSALTARINALTRAQTTLAAGSGASARALSNLAGGAGNAATHTHALALAHDALHSAARGVSGVMGGLFLTYGRMLTVLVAAAAAAKALKDSISGGLDAGFASQFSAVLEAESSKDKKGYLTLKETRDNIRSELVEIGRNSVFTVEENAKALNKLSLAGVNATDGLKLIGTAGDAAVLAQTDLAQATTMVLDAINNFGLASDNSTIMANNYRRVSDIMAFTANTVNASFSDIAAAFTNVTGVAGTFNVQIEETSALLQSLAKTGVRGSRAGTFTRNFFDDLLGAPISSKAEKTLSELGVDRFDPEGAAPDDFAAARYIDDLVKKIAEKSFVQQQDIIKSITNQRSRRVLRQELAEYLKGLKEVDGQQEQTNSLLKRTQDLGLKAEGSLSRMAEALKGDTKYQFIIAQAAYNASAVDAFSAGEESLTRTAQLLQGIFNSDAFRGLLSSTVSGFSSFVEAVVGGIKAVLDFSQAMSGVWSVIGDVAKWSAIAAGVYGISTAFSAAAKAVGAIRAVVTAIEFLPLVTIAATAAVRAFTLALAANPIVAAVVTLVALGTAFDQYVERQGKWNISAEGQAERLADLIKQEKELKALVERKRTGTTTISDDLFGTSDPVEKLKQVQIQLADFDAQRQAIAERQGGVFNLEKFNEEMEAQTAEYLSSIRRSASNTARLLRTDVDEVLRTDLNSALTGLASGIQFYEEEVRKLAKYGDAATSSVSRLYAVIDAMADRAALATEELERLNAQLSDRFLKAAGGGMEFGFKDLSSLKAANEELESSIEKLRLGDEGAHKMAQAHKLAQYEALKTTYDALDQITSMTDAALRSIGLVSGLSAEALSQVAAQRVALATGMQELVRNYALSETKRQLEKSTRPGPARRSARAPNDDDKLATDAANSAKRIAAEELKQWQQSSDLLQKNLELYYTQRLITEGQYNESLYRLGQQRAEQAAKAAQLEVDSIQKSLGNPKLSKVGRGRLQNSLNEAQERLKTEQGAAANKVAIDEIDRTIKQVAAVNAHIDALKKLGEQRDLSLAAELESYNLSKEADPVKLAGLQAQLEVTREYAALIADIKADIAASEGSPGLQSQLKAQLDGILESMGKAKEAARDQAERVMEDQRSFTTGWNNAFNAYQDDATNSARIAGDAFTEMAQGLEQSLSDFLFNPFDKGIKGMLQSFGQMIQRMIADAIAADITKHLLGATGSSGGSGGGTLGTIFQAASLFMGGSQAPAPVFEGSIKFFEKGGAFDSVGPSKMFAKGGAFGNGEILTRPTPFMFADGGTFGRGVAGEAGPEGALPLKRMPNGKLGVYTEGGGNQSVVINVNVASGTPAEVKRAAGAGARSALGALSSAGRFG